MLKLRRTKIAALIVVLLFSRQYTVADILYYPDQFGDRVVFHNIRESSSSIGAGPGQVPELYGPPAGVVSDTLVFRPALFEAKSVGLGINLVDGQLSFSIKALPGFVIDKISIIEFGDYSLATPFPGDMAVVSAALTGFVFTDSGVFSDSSAFTDLHSNAISIGKFGVPWSRSIEIEFPSTGEIDVDLDNTLTAASTLTAAAIIKKKRVEITIHVSPIPIPEPSLSLIGLALLTCPIGCRAKDKKTTKDKRTGTIISSGLRGR